MKKKFPFFYAAFVILSSSFAASAVSDDQHWDNQFGAPGTTGQAWGIGIIGKNIYTGGVFPTVGGTTANSVAGFDGTNWFELNSGLLPASPSATVICAIADGNYLYTGGIFTNADDPNAVDTARWDGTNWSGIGIQGVIETLRRNGTNLYFGGLFPGVGNVISTNIIGWNGTNWFSLGGGLGGNGFNSFGGSVNCIAFQGNNIYVGGNFSYWQASSMTNVAYWDGSAWHAMGNPFNGPVDGLTYFNDGYLYACGAFTNTTLHFTNVARWNGSVWSSVPGGSPNGPNVLDVANDGTNLYFGGAFTRIGGIAATSIVSFNGSVWTNLGAGIFGFQGAAGQVNKLLWQSNQLYVAGSFNRAGNVGAGNIARWDGTNWWNFAGKNGKGIAQGTSFVQSLFINNGPSLIPTGVYAGGLFTEAPDAVVNCIGRWDGAKWNSVGSGVSGNFTGANGQRVLAMASDGAYLYAGGIFTNAGGSYAPGIAYWDGSNWNPMGSGMDFIVNTICVGDANYIWVGGSFTNAGGIYSKGLATWVYGSWYNLGNVEGTNAIVYALAYDGGTKVYVAGQFFSAGGVAATNIAYFDDNDFSWHAVGPGLASGRVASLGYANGILYAGGTFTNAGSLTVKHIAQWNGSSWSALGTGILGNSAASVNGIAVSGANVYVTGNFTNAGGILASNVAVWNGSNWSAMGGGLTASVGSGTANAIAASGNDVYAAGSFSFAGDKPSQFFAHWNAQSNYYPAATAQLTRAIWQTNKQFKFRIVGTGGQDYVIQSSTNLTAWTSLLTNSTTYFDFVDASSTNRSSKFYRVVPGP